MKTVILGVDSHEFGMQIESALTPRLALMENETREYIHTKSFQLLGDMVNKLYEEPRTKEQQEWLEQVESLQSYTQQHYKA